MPSVPKHGNRTLTSGNLEAAGSLGGRRRRIGRLAVEDNAVTGKVRLVGRGEGDPPNLKVRRSAAPSEVQAPVAYAATRLAQARGHADRMRIHRRRVGDVVDRGNRHQRAES